MPDRNLLLLRQHCIYNTMVMLKHGGVKPMYDDRQTEISIQLASVRLCPNYTYVHAHMCVLRTKKFCILPEPLHISIHFEPLNFFNYDIVTWCQLLERGTA